MSDFAAGSRKSLLPGVLVVLALGLLAFWFLQKTGKPLDLRIPGTDRAPGAETGPTNNPVLAGKVTSGDGLPADLPGAWPGFRGPQGSGMSPETNRLARSWPNAGPRELWGVDVGEGYAGPSVLNGRVYLMDYDREKKQDALRCFSLADGREIWRFAYPVSVKRNHGMSRTIPTVTEKTVVAMGPKCHVAAVSATTGELKWALDLVRDYGTTVPQWYAGQCPLIEGDRVILAPGGPAALMIALDLETGKELWRTANPREWKMTHSSIVPMEVLGERIYVYCAACRGSGSVREKRRAALGNHGLEDQHRHRPHAGVGGQEPHVSVGRIQCGQFDAGSHQDWRQVCGEDCFPTGTGSIRGHAADADAARGPPLRRAR